MTMPRLSQKRLMTVALLVACIAGWTLVLWFFDAEQLVRAIGIENGYALMFLVATLGGVSSLGSVSYVATLITLSAGGLDPLGLALASGAGVTIGDTVYFLLGRHGRATLGEGRLAHWAQTFSTWLDGKPRYAVPLGIYLYTAFTPLPNDVLTIAMGVARRPYVPVILALVSGNMTLTFLIAKFGGMLAFL